MIGRIVHVGRLAGLGWKDRLQASRRLWGSSAVGIGVVGIGVSTTTLLYNRSLLPSGIAVVWASEGGWVDLDSVLSGAEVLYRRGEFNAAYKRLEEMVELIPNSDEAQWQLARSCFQLVQRESMGSKRAELIGKGLEAAKIAVDLNPSSAEAWKWYSVLLCASADYDYIYGRAAKAKQVLSSLTRAIELDQDMDPQLYALKGRLLWQLSEIHSSWINRTVAAALGVKIPPASYDESLTFLLEGEGIKNGRHENRMLIAQCYLRLGKTKSAEHWLMMILSDQTVPSSIRRDATRLLHTVSK